MTNTLLDSSSQKKTITYFLFSLLSLLVSTLALLASTPPTSRDALAHHLYVPKLYLEHGGIFEIPTISFSYYPMNLDLLYMIPLYFGNDIFPKYIHLLFALLTAWIIYTYLKNRISVIFGLLGSLFFLSIPIIVKLSTTAYVDLGLIFFTTASILLLFRWLNSQHRIRYLLLAGICCGLAVGVKYNGLITLFLLPMFIPVLYIRSTKAGKGRSTKGVWFAVLFTLAALIAFSPWLIRNYSWTSNPIYPLHNSLFQQPSSNRAIDNNQAPQKKPAEIARQLTNRGSGVFVYRKAAFDESWLQTLLLPIRFFYEGQDDTPRYFDGKLTPFLLLLPLFAFTRKSSTRHLRLEKYSLLAFAFLFFFFTFFQEAMRIRYIVCVIPPLVLLSIFGLHNLYSIIENNGVTKSNKRVTLLFVPVLGLMFGYNIQYIKQQFRIIQPLSYLQGTVSREQYITHFRPEYQAIQYANTHLEKETKVLCLFLGKRGYYMDFTPVFDQPFRPGILANIVKQLPQGRSIQKELLKQGFNYILLRDDLTQRWYRDLTKEQQGTVALFFQDDTANLVSSGGYSLIKIRHPLPGNLRFPALSLGTEDK